MFGWVSVGKNTILKMRSQVFRGIFSKKNQKHLSKNQKHPTCWLSILISDFSFWLLAFRKIRSQWENKEFIGGKLEEEFKKVAEALIDSSSSFVHFVKAIYFFAKAILFFAPTFFTQHHLSNSWLFQKLLFSQKSQELVLWIKQLGYSDFLKDVFAYFKKSLSCALS